MPARMPADIIEAVQQLRADGESNMQIGRLLHIHRSTVSRILGTRPEVPPQVDVPNARPCPKRWCTDCKAWVTTNPCIACRTRRWVSTQP